MAQIHPRLVLKDGSAFEGTSFGFKGSVAGEVVFNTGMVGYPESLTDPSYQGQILVLTYPLIGNYGVPAPKTQSGLVANFESERIQIAGLVIADYSTEYSHWSAVKSLGAWLKEEKIPGLAGIDCRAVTKRLREKGVMVGKIITNNKDIPLFDPNRENLVERVSVKEPVVYKSGKRRVALLDCGVKHGIIRNFLDRGVTVVRFPWDYPIFDNGDSFDALVISNGPGDPKMVDRTIRTIKDALQYSLPILGICLGNQLLALAVGAETYKLKYGHRSQNQPAVLVAGTTGATTGGSGPTEAVGRCYITAQNHGYAVSDESLPEGYQVWFRNANDGTNEGIRHRKRPVMSVQFHPEVSPGPMDTGFIFDEFLSYVR